MKGDWVVVAGASGAIGRSIVQRLASRDLGVVAVARTAEPLVELMAFGDRIVICEADITTDQGSRAIRAAVPGSLRMVVNSAAPPMGGGILEVSPSAVLKSVDVKVNGTLLMVRALLDRFGEDGRIVAIGGNLGYDPIPEAATSGICNAALANAMKQLSRAVGPRGITVNIVAPGPVWTARLQNLIRDAASERGESEDVVADEFRRRSPIGHMTTPEEVAWAVALLADSEAKALAGNTLILDAGQRTSLI